MTHNFIVSKARGPGDFLLTLGSRTRTTFNRNVTLDLLDLHDETQMWAKIPRSAADPGTFGLQNRRHGTWMQRSPVDHAGIKDIVQLTKGAGDPAAAGELVGSHPLTSYNDSVLWHDDHVQGPYNALVSARDWEQKLNIRGDGPYGTHSDIIMWQWCGGAENELWRLWETTSAPRPGVRVQLTNFEHVVQLGAHPQGTVYMHPNKDAWETWSVEDAGGGNFFLRSAHGTYLGSRQNGEVYLVPHRDAWERWSIVFDRGFRIRSVQWGLHLGSRPDGSIYTHPNCLQWERWWVVTRP